MHLKNTKSWLIGLGIKLAQRNESFSKTLTKTHEEC